MIVKKAYKISFTGNKKGDLLENIIKSYYIIVIL